MCRLNASSPYVERLNIRRGAFKVGKQDSRQILWNVKPSLARLQHRTSPQNHSPKPLRNPRDTMHVEQNSRRKLK